MEWAHMGTLLKRKGCIEYYHIILPACGISKDGQGVTRCAEIAYLYLMMEIEVDRIRRISNWECM
jgi:hypothetical protein